LTPGLAQRDRIGQRLLQGLGSRHHGCVVTILLLIVAWPLAIV
jgi:hypothetical protein